MPCEQFLNSFILIFYEGGGKLEKSQNYLFLKTTWTIVIDCLIISFIVSLRMYS